MSRSEVITHSWLTHGLSERKHMGSASQVSRWSFSKWIFFHLTLYLFKRRALKSPSFMYCLKLCYLYLEQGSRKLPSLGTTRPALDEAHQHIRFNVYIYQRKSFIISFLEYVQRENVYLGNRLLLTGEGESGHCGWWENWWQLRERRNKISVATMNYC